MLATVPIEFLYRQPMLVDPATDQLYVAFSDRLEVRSATDLTLLDSLSFETRLSEESPLGPVNVYGHTKLMIEEVLDFYRELHGLHYAALRYFNAAGALPDQGEAHQPESHLIPLVLQVPLGKRKDIKIFGTDYPTPDGTCIRDYIHIADLVSAHFLALDALEKSYAAGLADPEWMRQDSDLDNIRNHARYKELVKLMEAGT